MEIVRLFFNVAGIICAIKSLIMVRKDAYDEATYYLLASWILISI